MKYQQITIEAPVLTDEAAAYLHNFFDALMHGIDDQYYRQIHRYYANKLDDLLVNGELTEENRDNPLC